MKPVKLDFTAESDCTVENALRRSGVSRRLLTRLKHTDGGISLNGRQARSIDPVKAGDILTITDCAPQRASAEPSLRVFAPIVYEDDSLVVFDKPSGMPVHPSAGHSLDTLGNLFAALFPDMTFRPVNRLDKDTSGLCIAAKSAYAAAVLSGGRPGACTDKIYYAVVCGTITAGGAVDLPIAREQESIIKRCVREDGKPSVTLYEPVASSGRYTLLRLRLLTGRTHQIRVHMSHIGFPLAGDDLYGGDCRDIKRQALHCGEVAISHPITKERMTFISPLTDDMLYLIGQSPANAIVPK